MYQGKFEHDNPDTQATNTSPAEEMEFVRPVRRQRKKKKPMRTRDLIFWICVLSFVLVSVLALSIFSCVGVIPWLENFEYEAALPAAKSQSVYDQLFADPDWESIYKLAKEPNTKFENSASYAAYMEQLVGDTELRLVKGSAGTSGNYKYEIRMDKTKIASFTLLDSTTADGQKDLVLGDVEIIYERKEFCNILTIPGPTVFVNGVALDDSYVIKTESTNATEYLPAGVRGYETVLYRVDNLLVPPEVTVKIENGTFAAMDYDKDAKLYSTPITFAAITDAESNTLINTAQVYCKYMIGKANKTTLQQYFDSTSQAYKTMTSIDKWMQSFTGYHFGEATITEYYRYSDTLYSARVEMTLFVTRKNGSDKEYPLHSTFIMENQGGVWKAINMLNLSIQQTKATVRLTYFNDDTMLLDEMVDANIHTLTTPAVEVPEGKQLGWYIKTVDKNGKTIMKQVFQPDENGLVTLPEDYTLEPMVLYARISTKEA